MALFNTRPDVNKLVANIKRQQQELIDAAKTLRDLAAAKRVEAASAEREAVSLTTDADWAQRVGDKFGAMIK